VTLTDKQRLDRIERAIAQIASALQVTVGYRSASNGAHALSAIHDEQRQAIERERVKA
jgi:hypothetical protein